MLSVLEDQLSAALRQVQPADLTIITGPSSPPSPDITEWLVVNAVSLNRLPPTTEAEDNTRREPAFFQQRFTLPAAAKQKNFTLPKAATGKLATVQVPLGNIATPGDDYRLDGRLIRFYRAPKQPVIIDMQGERAQGYQETAPGWIDLELNAWAGTTQRVDALLTPALAAVLTFFVNRDVLELALPETTGLRLRLLKPLVRLNSIERGTEQVAQTRYLHGTARLQLRGELELTLTLGTPPLTGRLIDKVTIKLKK